MIRTFAVLLAITIAGIFEANAQKETIEGNGNVVTKEIAIKSFDAIKASGIFELTLAQGADEMVKIEADENMQPYFTVTNEGNTLVIGMKEQKTFNIKTKNKMKVYVRFKNLKAMDLSMVGSVESAATLSFADMEIKNTSVGKLDLAFSANKLQLKNNSVGKVKLAGKAQHAVVSNNGVGNLDAGSFVVQTMQIDNSGVGGAEVNAAKDLQVKDSMVGRVKNKGAAATRKNNKVEI